VTGWFGLFTRGRADARPLESAASMRIVFLGDVVGRSGRTAIIESLPMLRERYGAHFVVVNGENAAGGFGITEQILTELLDAGADVVTTGNHVWDQREALVFIERHERLLRPINFPKGAPGRGGGLFKAANGADVLVINAMGRVFMGDLDCPFRAVDSEIEACGLKRGADAILIDFHAEATSEKQALGFFVDGRASALIGTHTHVPTADEQVLNGGTAYVSDAGMCGDYDSVLGMNKEEPLSRFLTKIPNGRFQPALGEATITGVGIEIDDATGLAKAIGPIRLGGKLSQAEPEFWVRAATAV
jgi:2',3'-cyclic-nucleotide 2'-phosphodiesterase